MWRSVYVCMATGVVMRKCVYVVFFVVVVEGVLICSCEHVKFEPKNIRKQ